MTYRKSKALQILVANAVIYFFSALMTNAYAECPDECNSITERTNVRPLFVLIQ